MCADLGGDALGHLAHHGEDRALRRARAPRRRRGRRRAPGPRRSASASISSPGRLKSSSAAPRISCERITPLLPRAPSSAARATDWTISSRPISSIVRSRRPPCRRSSSSSTARSVSAMLSPVSPSATGKTLRSLTSWRRDSRCAIAPATSARKRSRLVSVTRSASSCPPEHAAGSPARATRNARQGYATIGGAAAAAGLPRVERPGRNRLRASAALTPCRPSGSACRRRPAAGALPTRIRTFCRLGRSAAGSRPSSGCGCCRTPDPSRRSDIPWPWRGRV